jgi:Glycosyl hydrolase family 9/Cellulase N-terminal ig-like domain
MTISRRDILKGGLMVQAAAVAGAIVPAAIASELHEHLSGDPSRSLAADSVSLNGQVWPKRSLMLEVLENSMDARFLSKPVHESLLVDDMETDRGWVPSPAVKMEYTTERAKQGNRSLRFRTNQIAGAGQYGGGVTGASIRIKFDPPLDWSQYTRISLWCYVHPTRVPRHCLSFAFSCAEAPNGLNDTSTTHFYAGLKPGEWNHIVWEIPEFQRNKITQFAISRPVWGIAKKGWEDEIIYDFDQLEVQRVDPKPYEGWAVAPDNIAFNHVGYLPAGEKLAIAGTPKASEFHLLDEHGSKTVATYPVKEISNSRGSFRVLDFSAFTVPGTYRLKCGEVTSRPFRISETVWDGTVDKLMNYFYGDRCGFEIPEFHDLCHTDVMATHGDEKRSIAGGWHDAGNLTQGEYRTDLCADAMARLYEKLNERNLNPAMQARLLEEARWGFEWSLKVRFGGGWRIVTGGYNRFTDNVIGTADDIVCPARNVPFESFCGAATAARASRVFKPVDAEFSAKLLAAAIDDFQSGLQMRQTPPVLPRPLRIHEASWRDELGYGTLAAVELYRATGQQQYADEAVRLGKLLFGMQEHRFVDSIPVTGYYYEDVDHKRICHDTHSSFEESGTLAFRALCEAFPTHADWAQWYTGAVLHSEFFLGRGSQITEPYGMLPSAVWRRAELDEWLEAFGHGGLRQQPVTATVPEPFRSSCERMFDKAVHLTSGMRFRAFPLVNDTAGHGNVNILLAQTGAMAAAAELRNDPQSDLLVARQLQWLFGGNPFSQTLMYGEGYDYQRLIATGLPDFVGVMPLGIDGNHDDAPRWTHTSFYATKDLWVTTSGRTILALAHAAMPARVSGSAPMGATFRESRTAKVVKVAPGKFNANLPAGKYSIQYGNFTKTMVLVSGGSYDLSLDPKHAFEMEISAKTEGKNVRVNASITGAGAHRIELRTFNCTAEQPAAEVTLRAGKAESLTWGLTVGESDVPWVLIAVPDGLMSEKKELFGVVDKLRDDTLTA